MGLSSTGEICESECVGGHTRFSTFLVDDLASQAPRMKDDRTCSSLGFLPLLLLLDIKSSLHLPYPSHPWMRYTTRETPP